MSSGWRTVMMNLARHSGLRCRKLSVWRLGIGSSGHTVRAAFQTSVLPVRGGPNWMTGEVRCSRSVRMGLMGRISDLKRRISSHGFGNPGPRSNAWERGGVPERR